MDYSFINDEQRVRSAAADFLEESSKYTFRLGAPDPDPDDLGEGAQGTDEPQQAPAPEQVEVQLTSNLLLVMPPRVEVDIVEWMEDHDPEVVRAGLVPSVRRASISTYVPMRVFHKMLLGRAKLTQFAAIQSGDLESAGDAIEWMVDMVLEVWKLSEPHMSREGLLNGLQLEQILELFQRFFGDSMRRLAERGRFVRALRSS